ncbi:MAG: flagellar export chaperone FliS [Pseudomonadota bacterium]|jgi:flagellar protein FliS
MYATATGHFASMYGSKNLSNVYRRIDIETGVAGASSHKLITMLFNGALDAMAMGKGAMHSGDVVAKCDALGKAVRIVDEGLKASLNLTEGGELAENLSNLYGYIAQRLTLANVRNDVGLIDECQRLLTPVRDAWVAVAPAQAEVVRASMEVQA